MIKAYTFAGMLELTGAIQFFRQIIQTKCLRTAINAHIFDYRFSIQTISNLNPNFKIATLVALAFSSNKQMTRFVLPPPLLPTQNLISPTGSVTRLEDST